MAEHDVSDLLHRVEGDDPSTDFVTALRSRLALELESRSVIGSEGPLDGIEIDIDHDQREATMEKRWWWGAVAAAASVLVVGATVVAIRNDDSGGVRVGGETSVPPSAPLEMLPPVSIPTLPRERPLGPGRYYVPISSWDRSSDDPRGEWGATIAVPQVRDDVPESEGWWSYDDFAINLDGDRAYVAIAFFLVDYLYADPCHWQEGLREPLLGPSAEEFAAAVAADPAAVSPMMPTAVDGHPAFAVEIQVPDELDECDSEEYTLFQGPFTKWARSGLTAGFTYTLTSVDVDGTRVVIVEATHPEAPAENVEQAAQVAGTIRFVLPGGERPSP